jgi:hypothetical protein
MPCELPPPLNNTRRSSETISGVRQCTSRAVEPGVACWKGQNGRTGEGEKLQTSFVFVRSALPMLPCFSGRPSTRKGREREKKTPCRLVDSPSLHSTLTCFLSVLPSSSLSSSLLQLLESTSGCSTASYDPQPPSCVPPFVLSAVSPLPLLPLLTLSFVSHPPQTRQRIRWQTLRLSPPRPTPRPSLLRPLLLRRQHPTLDGSTATRSFPRYRRQAVRSPSPPRAREHAHLFPDEFPTKTDVWSVFSPLAGHVPSDSLNLGQGTLSLPSPPYTVAALLGQKARATSTRSFFFSFLLPFPF